MTEFIAELLDNEKPDFVVFSGDQIESVDGPQVYLTQTLHSAIDENISCVSHVIILCRLYASIDPWWLLSHTFACSP